MCRGVRVFVGSMLMAVNTAILTALRSSVLHFAAISGEALLALALSGFIVASIFYLKSAVMASGPYDMGMTAHPPLEVMKKNTTQPLKATHNKHDGFFF